MSDVRMRCQSCKTEVTMPGCSIVLAIWPGVATYAYACPECGVVAAHQVGDSGVELLLRAEAPHVSLVGHPEHPKPGPGFTLDDLLELHCLLAEETWFEQLTL